MAKSGNEAYIGKKVRQMCRSLAKDSNGRGPRIAWLLRVDEQIKLLYGEYKRVKSITQFALPSSVK